MIYNIMRYLIIIMSILVILFIYLNNIEKFNVKRKRKGKKIQLGFLNNTPAPIKKLMTAPYRFLSKYI